MTSEPDDVAKVTMAELGTDWVTIGEAAERLGISVKTLRRRIKAGEVESVMAHDPAIGSGRYMVRAPAPEPPAAGMVPIEVVERLQEAWKAASEATARAEVAERLMAFERERRERAEQELDELRRAVVKPRRWWQGKP